MKQNCRPYLELLIYLAYKRRGVSFSFFGHFCLSGNGLPLCPVKQVNALLSKSSDLLGAVCDAHAHQEAVSLRDILACLELVIVGVELVDHAQVLEFVRLLVEGLPAHDEDAALVPREVHCHDVAAEGELLVGLQIDAIPLIFLNRVALNGVETLGLALAE